MILLDIFRCKLQTAQDFCFIKQRQRDGQIGRWCATGNSETCRLPDFAKADTVSFHASSDCIMQGFLIHYRQCLNA